MPSQAQSFTTLRFEAEGKPCQASINNRYIDFKDKSTYSLSLFIMVKTINKNKDGHPSESEALIFNTLQTEIITELSKVLGNFCYVGTTTMSGYRDILLYIKPESQRHVSEVLERLKSRHSRIESFGFEKDPDWEAVASFYDAINTKN